MAVALSYSLPPPVTCCATCHPLDSMACLHLHSSSWLPPCLMDSKLLAFYLHCLHATPPASPLLDMTCIRSAVQPPPVTREKGRGEAGGRTLAGRLPINLNCCLLINLSHPPLISALCLDRLSRGWRTVAKQRPVGQLTEHLLGKPCLSSPPPASKDCAYSAGWVATPFLTSAVLPFSPAFSRPLCHPACHYSPSPACPR